MLTVIAFIVALSLLIAIHEYGHYRVAVACGVKVLRFSIGMGKPLLRWRRPDGETEFVIAALPLGGYVRMLDEREGPVAPEERHRAFNTQPLRHRAAIVAAGPLANLVLAVALYAVVNWIGMPQPRAIVASPAAQSFAAQAGLRGQELVHSVRPVAAGAATSAAATASGQAGAGTTVDMSGIPDAEAAGSIPIHSFEDLRWHLVQTALARQDLLLAVTDADGQHPRTLHLPLSALQASDMDAATLERIGILAPWSAPRLGEIMPGSPAQAAGLQEGDVVWSVDGIPVVDAVQLRRLIRESALQGLPVPQHWEIRREGRLLAMQVTPEAVATAMGETPGQQGRIGAYIGGQLEMVTVQLGPLEGLQAALHKTWEVSMLSLQMMGRMLVGEASLKNLSGPLTIADYAGKSASLGAVQYLVFLALISVSLGILNLLPLPVLDGGHLMYYLWEAVTGRPVSDLWMQRLQRVGISALLAMMTIAFYNDINRLWG